MEQEPNQVMKALAQAQCAIDMQKFNNAWPTTSHKSKVLAKECPNKVVFMMRCNPEAAEHLIKYRRHPDQPTLKTVDDTYGGFVAVEWIMNRLLLVCEQVNAKDIMTSAQMAEMARAIMRNWSFLSLGDLDYFLQRFTDGYYGSFYGTLNPMIILERLRTRFLRERENEIAHYNRRKEKQEETASEQEPVMTPQEFCRLKGHPECTSILELMQILDTPSAE